jgi:elongator complex protein 1
MPRGNLEAIHPRAVTLHFARDSLDRAQFDEAYATLRRHRINLNLMVDHRPDIFMGNVDKFVAQMKADVQRICLFVADLV